MINLKKIIITSVCLFFLGDNLFANKNNNVLLNPSKNSETIIDIGYNNQVIPYSTSIPKTFIETPALSRSIDSYINVLKRDHEKVDCVTDDYGDTTCPAETTECLANVTTSNGNSTKHSSIQYINKNKISTTRANALYPNELKADYKLIPNIGAVDGSSFNITATRSYANGQLPSPTAMFNAGFVKNGKFTIKAFNFGSGYGQLYFNQTPSRTTTLISGGSGVSNGKISSPDGNYAIVEMQWDTIPSALTFGCDDYCLIGNPNDIGFGFWNVGCIAGYVPNDNILSESGKCKREYYYYTYDCNINSDSIRAEEQWVGPMNAGGDCQGIGLDSNLSCNSSIGPDGNCLKTNFTCPSNPDLPCTKIANEDAIVKNLYDGFMYNYGIVVQKYKEIEKNKTCEGSGTYSTDKDICIGNNEYSCKVSGFEYDSGQDKCLGDYVCNGYFAAATGLCETAPETTCPTGSIYDRAKKMCTGSAICENGTLNLVTLQCEDTPTCDTANGWVYDSTLKQCSQNLITRNPICPESFMAWNSSTHVCEGYMDTVNFSKVAVGGDTGNWVTQSNSKEIIQTLNGVYPTLFMTNLKYSPKVIKGKFYANSVDDDSIGLAFGFNSSTDFYALNWTSFNNTAISKDPIKTYVSSYYTLNNTSSTNAAPSWNSFLKTYGINVGIYNYEFEVKTSGTYKFVEQTDNYSTVLIDGVLIHTRGATDSGWADIHTYTRYMEKGMHSIYIDAKNYAGPAATAVVIYDPSGNDIWNTRNGYLKENYSLSCEDGFTLINNICYELNAWTKGSQSMTLQKISSISNYALDGRTNYVSNDKKWTDNKWYEMELRFDSNNVSVYIDNSYIMTGTGLNLPASSRIGFFNQSQANVNYKDFYVAVTPICESGYTYNAEHDICYNSAYTGTIDFNNRVILSNPFCTQGGLYDTTINECLYTPTCYVGGFLDGVSKSCVSEEINKCSTGKSITSGISYESCNETTLCSAPYALNKSTNKCEIAISNCSLLDVVRGVCYENKTNCSTGYTYNSSSLRCEKAISCQDGGLLNPVNKTCYKTINDSCVNTHLAGYDNVCSTTEICPTGSIRVSTTSGYVCSSDKYLECETGYTKNTAGLCVANAKCEDGYVSEDGKCKLTYNWAEYSCEEGWTGPLIDSGNDCNATCGEDGCWCNAKVGPANNCKKAFNLTNEENSYNLIEKRPVEYHIINGNGLSVEEYGEFKDYSCGENCTFDLISIKGKNNELCFEKRNGESSCLTVDKCYFEGEFNLSDSMDDKTKISNIFLEDKYTLKSNYVDELKNLGEPVNCSNGVYNSVLKKCEPFTSNLIQSVTRTASVVDYTNAFVTENTGIVTDYRNSTIITNVGSVVDYTSKIGGIETIGKITGYQNGVIGIAGNGLGYDSCEGGDKKSIDAISYCSSKGMRVPDLSETTGGNVNGVPSCGAVTLTSTRASFGREGSAWGYFNWNNTTVGQYTGNQNSNFYLKVRCVTSNPTTLVCPSGYIDNGSNCIKNTLVCPTNYIDNGTNCQRTATYNYYSYTCPSGYTTIDTGLSSYVKTDPNTSVENWDTLGTTVNNSIAPVGNCKKDVSYKYYGYTCPTGYTSLNNGYSSYTKTDSDKTVDNSAVLAQDVNSNLSPTGNCYKSVNYSMYEYTCPSGFTTVNSGYVSYERTDTDVTNINSSLITQVNSSTAPANNCLATSVCADNSFLSSGSCLSTTCEDGFYYNEIDRTCDQKIISTCAMNGNVGWKDRDNGIMAMANGTSAMKYVMFGVSGTEKYDNTTYWEGINIGKMAFKLSDGHWYVSSTYKDVNGNAIERKIPDFVQYIPTNNYEIYNKGSNCYDTGKNIVNYCATSFKLVLPENKMSIVAMRDIESLNAEVEKTISADNYHNLTIATTNFSYDYKGTGVISEISFDSGSTNTTKSISDFVDRMDFWDSFTDGYLGYIEFLRNAYDKDSEDGFIVENKEIYELSNEGVNIIDYIPSLNKSIYVSNAVNCSEVASKIGGTVLDYSMLTTSQSKLLKTFGINDYSCVLFSNQIDSFSSINWSFRKNTYTGNFTFRCSPYICSANGSCDIATCPTEDRTNPVETVEYIGTLLPTEFLPNLSNVAYCMEQKCDANLDYIDYCGYYQKCDMNNGNAYEGANGDCYEYYCETGSIFDNATKKCKKEGCPPGTKENSSGKCVLI